MPRVFCLVASLLISSVGLVAQTTNVQDLTSQFELPSGFHIYRAAGPELTGGSYDLAFDGEGRLLVADGNAVRRLLDTDGDGVFDRFEVIATGLGWRGPQGLLVYGDRLYAVGGDGIQLFEGYHGGGQLTHKGRIGNVLRTGGDHEGHTIFRGHDGFLYFVCGDGAGTTNRQHITEKTSPVQFARNASVFRISPDGSKWECLSTGGRNPPNLGMNYLGEFFSFDSDMEWHVGLPWYRPTRLNHWAIGGDQGWQEVGAFPSYYFDNLPGVMEVGRASPTWGVFYEHRQLPAKYRDAYIVCDYRWKRESNDEYNTTGRLAAFFLKRKGAGWGASMEVLAKPKRDARDGNGKLINFALVDVEVAPDGSLFLTDHNQGVWRIYYADPLRPFKGPPPLVPAWETLPTDRAALLQVALELPQPGSERTRLREEEIRTAFGKEFSASLHAVVLNPSVSQPERLRALRLLAPDFQTLPSSFVGSLTRDRSPEIRGQGAWLVGLRGESMDSGPLKKLLRDADPFVRRRAVEAVARMPLKDFGEEIVQGLADPDRLIRLVAMNTAAHFPARLLKTARKAKDPRILIRLANAARFRHESADAALVGETAAALLNRGAAKLEAEERLDALRFLALFRAELPGELSSRTGSFVLADFPASDSRVRWEQVRLIGEWNLGTAFRELLSTLEKTRDEVEQFHLAQALTKLSAGWSDADERRMLNWFVTTQRGWFSEFASKGVEFPAFWGTVLSELLRHHEAAVLREEARIDFGSPLGLALVGVLARKPEHEEHVVGIYHAAPSEEVQLGILLSLTPMISSSIASFLRGEFDLHTNGVFRGVILNHLALQPEDTANLPLLIQGLNHLDSTVTIACANAVTRYKTLLTKEIARVLLQRMIAQASLFYPLQKTMVALTSIHPPAYSPDQLKGRPEETAWKVGLAFWRAWYEKKFGEEIGHAAATGRERSDEELYQFLLAAATGGDRVKGGKVYEAAQCNTCHGGGVSPGREGKFFGPDLAGVTRRLSRKDLAEAIVYPSRQVADRYKAFQAELKDGRILTGFVTEQNAEAVTLADREQVHRFLRTEIQSLAPQTGSLMPDHLVNRLTDDEIRDLLAFLDEGAKTK